MYNQKMATIFPAGGIDLLMRVHILILLGCILPSLLSSSDEQDDDCPIRLTENAMGEHRAIEYIIWDQCMLQPGHHSINSFRMAFNQPEHFFCDNDGLLICYPSQLGQNNMVNGMVANVQYQISTPENNLVAQRCEAKRAEFCKDGKNAEHCKPGGIASIPWGGILIYTHPDHLDPMKTQIRLNLSVTNIGFELGLHQRILIKFGRKDAMNKTTVFAPGKRLHFEIDEQLGEQFIRNVHKGAKLRNYQGLWMLGLDVLPTKHVEQIHFFVYRDSKCAMQSWFLYPYEERNMRLWIPKLEMGSGDWLNQKLEENVNNFLYNRSDLGIIMWPNGKRITTWFLSNCKTNQVEIRLVDNLPRGAAQQIWLQFNITAAHGIVFVDGKLGKWDPFESRMNLTNKFLQCQQELQVEINLYGHFFEIILTEDDTRISNRFWPNEWWSPQPLLNVYLEVNGDAIQGKLQIEDVIADPNAAQLKLKLPYSQKLAKAITNGTKFIFRAKIKEDAKSFQINLLHDAPEWNENMGATVLHFKVEFLSDENETRNITTTWGAYDSGNKWYDNGKSFSIIPIKMPDNEDSHMPLTSNTLSSSTMLSNSMPSEFWKGIAFECAILVEEILNSKGKKEVHFTIEANNKPILKAINSKLPMWTLNWIQITGDLLGLTVPIVEYTEDKSGMYKHELEHLFAIGDILCIEGQTKAMPDNDGYFEINLFHESNEFSYNIGDTVMQANFYFNVPEDEKAKPNQIIFRRFYHFLGRWENDQRLKPHPIPWTGMGSKFIIKIMATEDKFEMEIDSRKSDDYSYEYSKDENAMPPWAANWLMLKGDLEWVKIANESEECMRQNATQKPLPPHIKQLDPVRALQLGDLISIEAEINIADSEKPQILVGLYREAFEWRPIIGHTVLQATFTDTHVSLTSYIGQQWKVNNSIGEYVNEIGTPISKLEKFELNISVTEEGYQLNGNALAKQLEYPRFVPLWAVQYISVQGDVKKETVSIGIKEGNEEMTK